MGQARSAEHYDKIYHDGASYGSPYWESVYYPAWMLVLSHVRRFGSQRVLDLGCGPGQFGEFLAAFEPGLIYFGLDFSSVAIELAKTRLPNAIFQVADLRDGLPFHAVPSQVVVALEMLEHIENDLGLIESLPAGCPVIFSVPDFDWESHVRFFESAEDVRVRYGPHLDVQAVDAVKLSGGATLFVVAGRRVDRNGHDGE